LFFGTPRPQRRRETGDRFPEDVYTARRTHLTPVIIYLQPQKNQSIKKKINFPSFSRGEHQRNGTGKEFAFGA